MAASLPDATTRWRCGGCGNLTRFDVTRSRRTTEFWHFDLAGDHVVEDDHRAGSCREHHLPLVRQSDAVELVSRAEADAASS